MNFQPSVPTVYKDAFPRLLEDLCSSDYDVYFNRILSSQIRKNVVNRDHIYLEWDFITDPTGKKDSDYFQSQMTTAGKPNPFGFLYHLILRTTELSGLALRMSPDSKFVTPIHHLQNDEEIHLIIALFWEACERKGATFFKQVIAPFDSHYEEFLALTKERLRLEKVKGIRSILEETFVKNILSLEEVIEMAKAAHVNSVLKA